MLRFWLKFAADYRSVLLDSGFIPFEPHFLYPVIKAQDAQMSVIGVYIGHKPVDVDASRAHVLLINATKEERLYLNMAASCTANVAVYSTTGQVVHQEIIDLPAGVTSVNVPCGGLIDMTLTVKEG